MMDGWVEGRLEWQVKGWKDAWMDGKERLMEGRADG